MASIQDQFIGTGVNMGIGRGLATAGLRLPVPLPSFYNSNSQNPFADSQAVRMFHGDRNAWKGYGRNLADRAIGGAIAGPLGAMAAPWVDRNIIMPVFNGLRNLLHRDSTPGTSVTVGDINTDGSGGGRTYINPSTGEVSYGVSDYGPYSSGYQFGQGGPSLSDGGYNYNHGDSVLPDFSQLGDYYAGNVDSEGNQIDKPTLKQRRENEGFGSYALSGISDFMVGGSPVINGVRPAMGNYNRFGGSGQGYVKGRDPGG